MPNLSLTSCECWRVEFPLRLSFRHNLATRNQVETLVIAVSTAGGTVGHGQVLPRHYLTGETIGGAADTIRRLWWPAARRVNWRNMSDLGQVLHRFLPIWDKADATRNQAAYSGIEVAVLDAIASERGWPLCWPAGAPRSTPLVGVVPAVSAGKAGWFARAYRWLGYRYLKVKVGRDADADARRLEAVRKVCGPDVWLVVDANQAWSRAEADKRVPALRRWGVRVVEEPLRAEEARDVNFSRLEKDWGVATMADELLCSLSDARRLLEQGGPSWWNLRVGKNGGFTGVGTTADLARRHGVAVYGGVLVGETSLLAAAGRAAHFSAEAAVMEYGFPRVFLQGDIFRGGPGGFSGTALPPSGKRPGLGVRLLRPRLEQSGTLLWREM